MTRVHLILASLAALHAGAAAGAETMTRIRVGDHPGFGRVVFDLPGGAEYDIVTEGERLLVVFRNAGPVTPPPAPPRNVRGIETAPEAATLLLAPGTQARPQRLGGRLVIDVFDPRPPARPAPRPPAAAQAAPVPPVRPAPAQAAPTPAALPPAALPPTALPSTALPQTALPQTAAPREDSLPKSPAPAAPAATRPASPTPDRQEATASSLATLGAAAAPVAPVVQEPLPPIAAGPAAPAPTDPAPPAPLTPAPAPFTLRADADVGAAAFRRGPFGIVVLDRRIPASPLPEGAEWIAGVVSSMVRLPLPPGAALRVTRVPTGWTVEQQADAPPPAPPSPAEPGVLPVPRPGRALAVADPLAGGTLLVGTSLSAEGAPGVPDGRLRPDYAVLPTWLGVAIEPASDRVDLRVAQGGFVLPGAVPPGAAAAATPVGARLSRRFDLPDQPAPALLNRLRARLAGAADAAPRARTRDRMAAAQDMIALGMGVEAQALLILAAAEDPQAAADAELTGLAAIAAVLADRVGETAGLDDPRLDGTDEIALWRGLRDRQTGRDTPAARGLGALAPLALAYPPTLRRLIWPEIADAAVESRADVATERLTPLAAARLLERDGRVAEAIKAYQAVADGPDRLAQVRAGARLAELRLSAGQITPIEAAAALERQSVAWRGDGHEAAYRLRAAELRGVGGDWREALDTLRTIEAQMPDQRPAIQARKAAILNAMLAADGRGLSAVQLVLLAAEHADAVPEGPAGAALARLLADRLAALDLPARAIPVLQGLMRAAPAGAGRAEFGGRLAQLLLDGGDGAGAVTALDASAAGDLPDGLVESRGLLRARARAAQGDVAGAAAGLFALGTATADDLRATLLANERDWRGSLAALADLAAKRVPPQGPLDDTAQDILLRQATAAAQAPDPAMLRVLERSTPRMTAPRADLFRVLTAAPLGAAADLPRAARELSLARAVPQHLDALRTR